MGVKEQLTELLEKEIEFLELAPWYRVMRRPFSYIPKVFFSRIYNHLMKNKPLHLRAKTFWGDVMEVVMPEDGCLVHWGLITGPEIDLTCCMISFIQQGDTVIDIGANRGFYSLLASRLAGKDGKVYSFEPTPSTAKALIQNCAHQPNITVEQTAVWNRREKITFTDFGEGYSAYNSYLPETLVQEANESKTKKNIEVDAVPLDEFVIQAGIKPHFIKLDVEGAELFALQGMRNTLIQYSPRIAVEFWVNDLWVEKNDQVLNLMDSLRYEPYKIVRGELQPYLGERQFPHAYTNLVFVKQQK